MLENWCWTPSQLKSLSQHYSYLSSEYAQTWKEQSEKDERPSEKIPDELISNLIKTKHVNDALFNLRQLHFGIFDMTVHEPENHEAIDKLDISQKFNALRKEISHLDGPEVLGEKNNWGNGQATFGHLIGGYDAGYYGYLRYAGPMLRKKFQHWTVTSSGPSQEGRMLTFVTVRKCILRICSLLSSKQTRWIQRKAGDIGIPFSSAAAVRRRCKLSRTFWEGSRARRRSTEN